MLITLLLLCETAIVFPATQQISNETNYTEKENIITAQDIVLNNISQQIDKVQDKINEVHSIVNNVEKHWKVYSTILCIYGALVSLSLIASTTVLVTNSPSNQ